MFKPALIYSFDAWCGWCYGFSGVIKKIAAEFAGSLAPEALSGGMILPEKPVHISATAKHIQQAYPQVEATTGVKFGSDYLWHINNPDESDWYPHSEKPAIALCILKEYFPNNPIALAADIQYALHYEGRDLTDNEAYRKLVEGYGLNADDFIAKLSAKKYRDAAYEEFEIVKQLQVSGFPTVHLQIAPTKFYLVAHGYTPEDTLRERINAVLDAEKLS